MVFELLSSIGEVQSFERCRSKVGEFAIPNLQYTAVLKKVTPHQVPDRFTLEIFGERFPVLLITKGKPRCCFLCGSCSHTHSLYPDPYCRYCNKRGHYVSNCPKKKPKPQSKPQLKRPLVTATETPEAEQTSPPAAASDVIQHAASQQAASQQPAQLSETESLVCSRRPRPSGWGVTVSQGQAPTPRRRWEGGAVYGL